MIFYCILCYLVVARNFPPEHRERYECGLASFHGTIVGSHQKLGTKNWHSKDVSGLLLFKKWMGQGIGFFFELIFCFALFSEKIFICFF